MQDSTWREHENIRKFEIELNDKSTGIIGSVAAAILESHGEPVLELDLKIRQVDIEGKPYKLQKSIRIEENLIKETGTSITINDDGEIKEDKSSKQYARSASRLSLHGIEVPTSLFTEWYEVKNNQVRLAWPLPLAFVIDVCGNRDLDLNSPRTEIIISDKWFSFEEEFAYLICNEIAKNVDKLYWDKLKEIFTAQSKNKMFLSGMNRVTK
jgi:hypothetical protein